MTSYSRGYNLKVLGVLVLAALVLFTGAFVHMTNRSLTQQRSVVFVRVPTATGLLKGDKLVHRGVQVGEVKKIHFGAAGDVVIEAKLTEKVPLTGDARAALVASDMFGRQMLVLRNGVDATTPLANGDTIEGSAPVSMAASFEDIGGRVKRIIGDTTTELLHSTLGTMTALAQELTVLTRQTSALMERESGQLHQVAERAGAAMANLEAATAPDRVEPIQAQLLAVTARLDTTLTSMQAVTTRLAQGDGSAGKLLADTVLYERVTGSLGQLEALLRDVREHPKRYINVKIF